MNRISAAPVTSRPVRARPATTALSVSPRLVVLLAHPGQDEHLVVHRQPEQEREDQHRQPERHRARRRDAEDLLRAVAVLPEQHGRAERRGHRDDVEQHGLDRQQDRPERAHQQEERHERDQPEAVGELLVDRVDVVEHRRARHRRCRRSPGRRRARRATSVDDVRLASSRRSRPCGITPTSA